MTVHAYKSGAYDVLLPTVGTGREPCQRSFTHRAQLPGSQSSRALRSTGMALRVRSTNSGSRSTTV